MSVSVCTICIDDRTRDRDHGDDLHQIEPGGTLFCGGGGGGGGGGVDTPLKKTGFISKAVGTIVVS